MDPDAGYHAHLTGSAPLTTRQSLTIFKCNNLPALVARATQSDFLLATAIVSTGSTLYSEGHLALLLGIQ